jgi:hypothetical protein
VAYLLQLVWAGSAAAAATATGVQLGSRRVVQLQAWPTGMMVKRMGGRLLRVDSSSSSSMVQGEAMAAAVLAAKHMVAVRV